MFNQTAFYYSHKLLQFYNRTQITQYNYWKDNLMQFFLFQPMQEHRVTFNVYGIIKYKNLLLTVQNVVFEAFWPVKSSETALTSK